MKLAIKGHKTRGDEVIEILEMLGGKNTHYHEGYEEGAIYIVDDDWIGCYREVEIDTSCITVFTLEEFLEKFPYKVGDKVIYKGIPRTITKMVGEAQTSTIAYKLDDKLYCNVVNELQPYKEETIDMEKFPYKIGTRINVKGDNKKRIATIVGLSYNSFGSKEYEIKFDGEDVIVHYPTDLMIPIREEQETMEETIKIDIPKGYEFVGVDDDNQQVVFEKIGCQYPKTYEECCKILSLGGDGKLYTKGYNAHLIQQFHKLLICRDAYWKIAGDWKPDVMYGDLYCIGYDGNIITWKMQGGHRLLAFPTEEMRDAFYENFKELIENCKELL